MRIFRPIVEITMLPKFHVWQYVARRGTVAPQLIGNNHTWRACEPWQELAEKLLGYLLVAPTSPGNIEDIPLLLHDLPEIGAFAVWRPPGCAACGR